MRLTTFLLSAVTVLCAGMTLLQGFARPAASPGASALAPAPEPGVAWGLGTIEPVGAVRRLTFRTGGVIDECLVETGQQVRRGDVLMRLDDSGPQADLRIAEAELELARAERDRLLSGAHPSRITAARHARDLLAERLRFHRSEHERTIRLHRRNAVTEAELSAAETSVRQAEAALEQQAAELEHLELSVRAEQREAAEARVALAEAQVAAARRRLDETTLRAPCDGRVLDVLAHEGEGVPALEPRPVLLLADVDRLQVRAEIDERFLGRLATGQPAVITGRGLAGRRLEGTVTAIKPLVGRKGLFSGSGCERRDLDVVEVLVAVPGLADLPVGLQVDVAVQVLSAPEDSP